MEVVVPGLGEGVFLDAESRSHLQQSLRRQVAQQVASDSHCRKEIDTESVEGETKT